MKVVFQNPSKELLHEIGKKLGSDLSGSDEITLSGVIDIKDMRKIASSDFALYRKDSIIYVDNADFSSMEVQL